MIIGLGNDVVQIPRIEKALQAYGNRFAERCFTQKERETAEMRRKSGGMQMVAAAYAKRFAAKEALLKAIGCGFRDGVSWQDMEVLNDESGHPRLKVSGQTKHFLEQRAGQLSVPAQAVVIHLALSDDYPVAIANVVVEG